MSVYVEIIGSMPCCICGEMMSQKDIDNQEAILSGNQNRYPFLDVIAHVRHFYLRKKNFLPTDDYELNMAKFAFAIGEKTGWLKPEQRKKALAEIARLEKKYERN